MTCSLVHWLPWFGWNVCRAKPVSNMNEAERQTGAKVLLGYNWYAPLDATGAPARIVQSWLANRGALGDVDAWMQANDNPEGRNACAIEKGLRYNFFKKTFILRRRIRKIMPKEDW